MTAADFCR